MRKKLTVIFCIVLVLSLLGGVPALAADGGTRMTTSEAGITFIKYYEGFRSQPYPDGTGYAIGYGTHVDTSAYPNGITEEQADALLRGILSAMEDALYDKLLNKYNVTLTQNQFDALMDLTYNLSVSWMSTDYRLFNMLAGGIGRYGDEEIIDTFARYSKAGSSVLDSLAWRRLADAKVFLYGDYKFGGTQNYEYDLDADGYPNFHTVRWLTISKFSDVNVNLWSYGYIAPLTFLGVVEGYGDGSFRPNQTVTCGEALKLILLALDYGVQAPTDSHWASGYLSAAVGLGILSADDMPDLDAPITRALMARLAAGAAELPAYSGAAPFADTADASVGALWTAGLVQGETGAGGAAIFRPDDTLTRGELCAVVWRLENYAA